MSLKKCVDYEPDKVFKNFYIIEFPMSVVGLCTKRVLNVGIDLMSSAYVKTTYNGKLMEFEEARKISPSHRAFELVNLDNETIEVTFLPKNECISKSKQNRSYGNRFVCDLRIIQVNGLHCCFDEMHSEVARYYLCGQFAHLELNREPHKIDFNDIFVNEKGTQILKIYNASKILESRLVFEKQPPFEAIPNDFVIKPNNTVNVIITMQPRNPNVGKSITFRILNLQNFDNHSQESLKLTIPVLANIKYNMKPKINVVESLHKLTREIDPDYTYCGKSLTEYRQRQETAFKQLETAKAKSNKVENKEVMVRHDKCYAHDYREDKLRRSFCDPIVDALSILDLFHVTVSPQCIDFGKVAPTTHEDSIITIKNATKKKVFINLLPNKDILYTTKKNRSMTLTLKPLSTSKVTIYCLGCLSIGAHLGTFEYKIAENYFRQHLYKVTIENPFITMKENIIKLGLVTAEHFVTNVPIRLINEFNVPINFDWEKIDDEKPFYIKPPSGVVKKRSCFICDLIYTTTNTKSKVHELNLTSRSSNTTSIITLEVNIISRKLTIKFTQPSVLFQDIPLNINVKRTVYLENMSREICLYNVIDPFIPGFCIKPMGGIINPKTIVTFTLSAKFSCIVEFSADILVKINNKENVVLTVYGNVLEPKVVCYPRNISVPRVPSCMVAYVAVNLKNLCHLPMHIDILDTGDENMFDVCIADGNDKLKINELFLEGGRSKTVYIKIYDDIRREYDFYIPLQVNGLLGPPNANPHSIEFRRYVEEHESLYTNNAKTRVKTMYRDITYCRISGVITMPQVKISRDIFNFNYVTGVLNSLEFTITNISKTCLVITIVNSKLYPNYSMTVTSPQLDSSTTGTLIKFPLNREEVASFTVKFHPREMGTFTATALLYLDAALTIPYHNLTFTGNFLNNSMKSETSTIIFPPCLTKTTLSEYIILVAEGNCAMSSFRFSNDTPEGVTVEFMDVKLMEKENYIYTKLKVKISLCFSESNSKHLFINFYNENGASCSVTVVYCYTTCSLSLHATHFEKFNETYPLYPSNVDNEYFDYMETCSSFLEKWLFQQGFRRDLYPSIPETFHAISSNSEKNPKGINASYQNFIKRIAGPLAKHIGKECSASGEDGIKVVNETYEAYKEIVKLLKSRKADLGVICSLYLLSYDQFNIYLSQFKSENPYNVIDDFNLNLLSDMDMYNRLNKQCWIDFILQTYKSFVLDSCFFECTCVSNLPRDINKIIMEFINDRIINHEKITEKFNINLKPIENLTTDLQDCAILIVLILSYCPYLEKHFSKIIYCQDESQKQAVIIHNSCLLTEALSNLRINFPITSEDFLRANYIQMLFLSVHLYVTLPMLEPKDTIKLTPALQKSSARLLTISPMASDSLVFSFFMLKNKSNNFVVEKVSTGNANKKVILSVKYYANFVREETSTLIVYGYNKSRIFDTFVVFTIKGEAGFLNPFRKYKIAAPLYKPNKTDIVISSPFTISSTFKITVTEKEPTLPENFDKEDSPKFYIRRVNLVKAEIELDAVPNDLRVQDFPEQKLNIEVICLSTQVRHSWLWFRSDIGEFFVKVSSHPRVDVPLDIFHVDVPVNDINCSCLECDCSNIVSVIIPHCNELMVKSMKYALMMNASIDMINVFDKLIETETGRVILSMIFEDNNVDINEFNHILNTNIEYRYNSKNLICQDGTHFSMDLYSSKVEILEIEVPVEIDDNEKYTFTLESKCGLDVRTFRIIWETNETKSDHASRTKTF